jgi:hypothetical protein
MPWAMAIFVRLARRLRHLPATSRRHGVVERGAAISLQGSWIRK